MLLPHNGAPTGGWRGHDSSPLPARDSIRARSGPEGPEAQKPGWSRRKPPPWTRKPPGRPEPARPQPEPRPSPAPAPAPAGVMFWRYIQERSGRTHSPDGGTGQNHRRPGRQSPAPPACRPQRSAGLGGPPGPHRPAQVGQAGKERSSETSRRGILPAEEGCYRLHLSRDGRRTPRSRSAWSAPGIHDAKGITLGRQVHRPGLHHRGGRIGKVDGHRAPTDEAVWSIRPLGLSEVDVLRILAHLGDGHRREGPAAEERVDDIAQQHLTGRRGGQTRTGQHIGHGVGVKTGGRKAQLRRPGRYAPDQGRGGLTLLRSSGSSVERSTSTRGQPSDWKRMTWVPLGAAQARKSRLTAAASTRPCWWSA